jgi:oxygen-independent coproporphyrinogen-3 oxidase
VQRGVSLDLDDLIRACVIQLIMCQRCVSFEIVNTRFNIDFESYFEFELMQLSLFEEDGLLRINKNQLVITTNGSFFLRNISMVFEHS